MLSLMEYIGAQKILKSQSIETLDKETMSHLSEELRHAQVFKKLALKCDPSLENYSPSTVVAFSESKSYMQTIDHGIAEKIGSSKTKKNYALTTLVVEERAKKVYPLFSELFSTFGASGPIRAILREEEGHLEEVLEQIKAFAVTDLDLEYFRSLEEAAFQSVLSGIKKDCDQHLRQETKPNKPSQSKLNKPTQSLGGLNA